MRYRTHTLRLGASLLACILAADLHAAADSRLRAHIERLASPDLEGRLTGTQGELKAAEYLAEELEQIGAEPLPGQKTLLLPFEFTAGSRDAGSSIKLAGAASERSWSGTDRVQALSFSESAAVSGAVVFAGYGLTVPEGQRFPYDSYATLDVEDKIVLVLRYFPEDLEQEDRAVLARYSGLRYKAMAARERGAKAILVTTGPRSPNAGETVPMTFDTALSGSGIVAASVGGEVATAIFAAAGRDLESVQQELDTGNPHITGFAIPDLELTLDVKVERERRTGHNVAALLPGGASDAERPYVLLGAHFDHLGRGRHGNSLARKGEAGEIHLGADDNASGSAALLEVGRQLAGAKLGRRVALAFWSGEELGLLGSSDFVKRSLLPVDRVAAYVNLDMVGRMRENRLSLQATDSSSIWPRLIERSNVPVGFDLELQGDPYLPTDSATFNLAQVPTLNLFTGAHVDYHRPSDTPAALNYEDLERVTRFTTLLTRRLADLEAPPPFVQVARKAEAGGSRDTVRAFTGTIPDYTTEAEGLLLSGVIEGGPADEAGLEAGDVIVQLGEQAITNIYDYTYALDAVKVDQPLEVIYLRGGERRETTIVPRARR